MLVCVASEKKLVKLVKLEFVLFDAIIRLSILEKDHLAIVTIGTQGIGMSRESLDQRFARESITPFVALTSCRETGHLRPLAKKRWVHIAALTA